MPITPRDDPIIKTRDSEVPQHEPSTSESTVQQESHELNQPRPSNPLLNTTFSHNPSAISPHYNQLNMSAPQSFVQDKLEINIQRLKGAQNWASWKWQILNALDVRGLRSVLTGNDIIGSSKEVATRQILSSSLDQSLVCKVCHCSSAQQIWKCLISLFENNTTFALTELNSKMNSYKMSSLDDVEAGISEIQRIASQIQSMGGHADQFTIESAILRALPESFEPFISSWTLFDTEKRTVENLQSYLLQTVSRMRSRNQVTVIKEKALVAGSSKSKEKSETANKETSGTARKNGRKFCRYCKKQNHDIKDCRKLAKKKENETKEDTNDHSPTKTTQSTLSSTDKSSKTEPDSQARTAYGHVATTSANCFATQTSSKVEYIESFWIADSGASFHMTSNFEWIANYEKFVNQISVRLGDNHIVKAHGKGFIETSFGVLDPVYYLPEIGMNLFSISSCAKNHNVFSLTTNEGMTFLKEGKELFKATLTSDGLYVIRFVMKLGIHSSLLSTTLDDWHNRLGHCSIDNIKRMAKENIVEGMLISDNPNKSKCQSCAENKITRSSHPSKSTPRAEAAGIILHFDTVGPFPEPSLGGSQYYVLCKDSFSAYRIVFFAQHKSEIPDKVKKVISQAKLETGNDVLQIITDNGSEFLNHKLKSFLDQNGICHQTSAVYTPEQNGLIERDIRTVAEAAGSIRTRANLPKQFWAEAVDTSVYTLNRVINSINKDATPYELWFNRKPSLKNIHRFGERAIVYTETHSREKLDPKGIEMIFVGYTHNFNTLRFIDPNNYHLVKSCNYLFLNKDDDFNHIEETTAPDQSDMVSFDLIPQLPAETSNDCSVVTEQLYHEHNDDHDKDISQTEIINFESDSEQSSSSENLFVTPAKMPPEKGKNADRMASLRPRTSKPNYMNFKTLVTAEESEMDPITFEEAMSRPDAAKWKIAMQDELDSLDKNQVWTLINPPKHKNIVSNRWVYRIKRSPDGKIERYRARLVARGFSQVEGIDYFETYSPTVSTAIVRLLFAYAAIKGLFIKQFDIKCAFLYGDLKEEVYMSQPTGFETGDNRVCLLKRSLYGLKQAPLQWCRKFSDFLLTMKLKNSIEDRCVFYRKEPFLALIIYVDDGVIFAQNPAEADNLVDQLSKRFELHSMELATFLGFQIVRHSSHSIALHQTSYIKKVLLKYNGSAIKSEQSPISPTGGSNDESPLDPKIPFREIVGSLLYAAITTRIDIAYPVGLASRSVANPKTKHWHLIKRIMRYLYSANDLSICYDAHKDEGLIAFCDSDYANDVTGRSTTGMMIMLAGAPIHWRSVRQTMVALSPTEAEMVSLCSTVKEMIWLRNVALELGIIGSGPSMMYCDNTSAIKLASNDQAPHRTKHLRAQFAFCREQVSNKNILVKHISSKIQPADMLTKPLPVKTFISARNKIMRSLVTPILAVALVAYLNFTVTSGFKFDSVGPVLYQETDKYVDGGVSEYTIDYSFINTCNILSSYLPPVTPNQPPTQEESYVRNFINDCHQLYEKAWLVKINELLARQPPTKHIFSDHVGNIVKRDFISNVISATCVSNLICTLVEPILPWSQHHKINDLQEIVQQEQLRFQKFQHDFNVTLAIQKGIIDMIANNTRSIREQQRQFGQFIHLSSKMTWLSSYIQTRIFMASGDLRTIIDYLTRGQVATLELSELLNITEIRNIDPRDTEFISVQQLTTSTLRFKFNVRLRSNDCQIYQVHSFRYWDNLTHVPNLLEYQGRDYVLWNKTANCIKGIERPIDRAILDECSELNYKDPDLNIWRSIITTSDVYKNNIASYKHSFSSNFIYCFPWNITINGETTRCPILIFKLDSRISFNTRNISYKGIQRKIMSSFVEQPFIESVSLAHFDSNKIASNNLAMFDRIQELQALNEDLIHNQNLSIIVTKHGIVYWLTICTVGLMIIIFIGLLLYSLQVTKRVHAQGKSQSLDLQELKRIYEPVSCINCTIRAEQSAQQQQQTTVVSSGNTSSSTPHQPSVDATNQPITINFGPPLPNPNS